MAPIPSTVTLPIGYEPVKKTDSKGKNGEWQCPVIGCGKVYTRKRPLMDHLGRAGSGGHLGDKLVDTSVGTFTIKPATADGDNEEVVDDVGSPALSASLAAGLGVDLTAPSPPAPSMTGPELQADAAEVAQELAALSDDGLDYQLPDQAEVLAQGLAELGAAQTALELQVAMATHVVPGFEGDYLDLGDFAPPPPKKKRKGKKLKVEQEHKYASLKELEDEVLCRQLARRQQGFASDITASRDSGGFEQDSETVQLLDEGQQRELFLKQIKEKDVAKAVHAGGGEEDKSGKGKKQITIKKSLIKGNKNEKYAEKDKEHDDQPKEASEEEQQGAVSTQMEIDEEI